MSDFKYLCDLQKTSQTPETIGSLIYCEELFDLTKQENFPGDDYHSCEANPSGASLVILEAIYAILGKIELARGATHTDKIWAEATRNFVATPQTISNRIASLLDAYKEAILQDDAAPRHAGFWDCNCLEFYIRPVTMFSCPFCSALRKNQLPSRLNEVYELFPETKR